MLARLAETVTFLGLQFEHPFEGGVSVLGRPRKLTPEQENLARRLVSEGKAVRELAVAFKVHAATIYRLAYSATGTAN
jgi:DNA invertase Pin-like site-specific DNA recombinase